MKASFRVADKHTVQCYWSLFGLETYSVDGKEVLRTRSLGLRSRQQFKVGEGEDEHAVTIEIDFAPNVITLLIHPENWIARAYVDGVLAVEDLTPRPRSTVRVISRISNYGLLIALGILAVTILCIVVQYFRLR